MLLFVSLLATVQAADDAAAYPKSVTLSYEVIGAEPSSVKPLATVFYNPATLKYTISSWTPASLETLQSTTPESTSSRLLRILLPNGSSTVTALSTFGNTLSQKVDLWLSSDADGSIYSASVTSSLPAPLTPEEERLASKIQRAKAKGKPIPSVKPTPKSKKIKTETETEAERQKGPTVKINLIAPTPGPTAKLGSRKPAVIGSDGQEIPAAQEEKSFFQKYWWMLLIAGVLALSSGGEK